MSRQISVRVCLAAIVVLAALWLASCAEPSPLFGTWADNRGNTISFFDDNTFSTKIGDENYSGNFSLLLNSLTMNCTDIGLRVVTEWDIRGNILYLNWVTPEGDNLPLTLFKVSN
jgi:hypothetical protein